MEILRAENLVKTFQISEKQRKALDVPERKKVAVNGISFTAHSGEVFGLLGPNGAGKTTTMRMLSTLIKPDSGDVFYNDKSAVKNPTSIRSEFAFLTTDLKLDMKSTADEMFDFFSELYHIPSETAKKRKSELFENFGITSFTDTKISKLSQGMRQKVSLIISVIHNPKVIIFDEPTNGLDIIAARDVRDFMLTVVESFGEIVDDLGMMNAYIPAWNTMVVMQDVVACDYSPEFVAVTCIVNLLFAAVAIFVTGRLFENEKIVNG